MSKPIQQPMKMREAVSVGFLSCSRKQRRSSTEHCLFRLQT